MKVAEPFVSINELSKRLNVPAHTLRYWEKQFPTAIKPTTGAGGRRYYRADVTNAVEAIQNLLHEQGYTIAGVQKLIANGGLNGNIVGARGNAPAGKGDVGANNIRPKNNARRGGSRTALKMSTSAESDPDSAAEIDAALSLLEQARATLVDA